MIGIDYYINDINTRLTNEFSEFTCKHNGIARLDVRDGLAYIKENGEYKDALFDDRYQLSSFFIELGERQMTHYSFTANLDLIVCANMKDFGSEEYLIEKVYESVKVTQLHTNSIAKNQDALAGMNYTEKLKETIYPYFVFRFKGTLLGILKQKENGIL